MANPTRDDGKTLYVSYEIDGKQLPSLKAISDHTKISYNTIKTKVKRAGNKLNNEHYDIYGITIKIIKTWI